MSTPLNSLKKQRKAPLPSGAGGLASTGNKWVPFRQNVYSADENKLLEEITVNMANSRLKDARSMGDPVVGGLPRLSSRESPRMANTNTAPKGSAASNHELMSLMMARLSQLEQRLQYQTKDIIEKDKKIKILQEKLWVYQKAQKDAGDNPGQVRQLEKKCLLLQQQVHEMESFLTDYGMVWVGEKSDPDSEFYHDEDDEEDEEDRVELQTPSLGNGSGTWRQAESLAREDSFTVDYDKVLENIEDLNAVAGEGIGRIQHTTDGARLKMPDPVPLTLYANGIIMFAGPFRPFSEPSTQDCLRDIMDGFFPAELQDKFPDGVPFGATDKRTVHFKDKWSTVFQGSGQKLGGETVPSRLVPSNLNKASNTEWLDDDSESLVETTSEIPRAHGPKLTMQQFVNKLPKNIVKNGKVVDVRGAVVDIMKGDSSTPADVTVVDTSALQDMKDRLELAESSRPPSCRNVTTLRVKSETGDHTYILKMKFTETIGDLHRYLDQQRPKGAAPYQIISTFPSQVYSNKRATLQECGLVPSAALHLRPKK